MGPVKPQRTPKKPNQTPKISPPAKGKKRSLDLSSSNPGQNTHKKPRSISPPPPATHDPAQARIASTSLPTPEDEPVDRTITPPAPAFLPANSTDFISDTTGLLPQLMSAYTVTTMQIISSSKMSSKITRALSAFSFAAKEPKPNVVMLYAKAPVVAKMISVVEVVKREVERSNGGKGKWFQYNRLDESMSVYPRKAPKAQAQSNQDKSVEEQVEGMEIDGPRGEQEVEEEGFETMKTRIERMVDGTDKVRSVPVMTVYLSRVRIEKLRGLFGEQTNALT